MVEISGVGVLTAFLAGAISFLSPCVLPLVPGYISYVAGGSVAAAPAKGSTANRLYLSLCFVLGFTTVFVTLGATATLLGDLLARYRYEAGLIGGAIIVVFGLFTMGILRISLLERDLRFHGALPSGGPIAAYALGLAFAFGWTPCIGPVLGAILGLSVFAASADGMILLAIYSLGLGVPFLLAAAFTDVLVRRVRAFARFGRALQVVAGGIMVVMGIAVMTGRLTDFAAWLLVTFPALSRLG